MVGPVLDADGVAVTDGVIGDFKRSKNGAAPGAFDGSATLTHRHTGFYSLAAAAADLDTVGSVQVTIDDTVNACPMLDITVIEEAIYDAVYAASANAWSGASGSTTLTALASGSITAAVIATGAIDADAIADNAIDAGAIADGAIAAAKIASGAITSAKFAAGAIDATAIATNAIDADALAADAVTEIQSGLATAAGVSAVEADTQDIQNRLPDALVSGRLKSDAIAISGSTAAADAVEANIGNLDAAVSDVPTNAELATALAAADDAVLAAIAALPTANANADALLDRTDGVETNVTLRKFCRAAGAILAGIISGAGTGTEVFKALAAAGGGTTRVTIAVDASGNRSAVSLNL